MTNKETKHKYQDEILNLCHMKHLTAEEILKKIKKKYPSAGQATIYRTIKNLTERNLLNKISSGNNKNYYEKADSIHGHYLDEKNIIKDFDLSEQFILEIEKKIGKKIKAIDLKVFV